MDGTRGTDYGTTQFLFRVKFHKHILAAYSFRPPNCSTWSKIHHMVEDMYVLQYFRSLIQAMLSLVCTYHINFHLALIGVYWITGFLIQRLVVQFVWRAKQFLAILVLHRVCRRIHRKYKQIY